MRARPKDVIEIVAEERERNDQSAIGTGSFSIGDLSRYVAVITGSSSQSLRRGEEAGEREIVRGQDVITHSVRNKPSHAPANPKLRQRILLDH